jgi:nitrogen permease regulator 2-like protein
MDNHSSVIVLVAKVLYFRRSEVLPVIAGSSPRSTALLSMASFPRVAAIFYAIFDPHKGADVLVQSPDEAITPHSPNSLFDFGAVAEFIIPKKEMCNRLISICTPSGCRILGFPVHIPDSKKYQRNFLIYNLAFVFVESVEVGSYVPVVKRLALTLKQLEVALALPHKP